MMKILAVCHDAGGAEVVAGWLKHEKPGQVSLVAGGPASKIFVARLPTIPMIPFVEAQRKMPEFDLLLTGTSWSSNLELRAIAAARSQGLRVATFVDHWNNYRGRFQHEGKELLPDEVWAGDTYAFELAEKAFPEIAVRLVTNYYLQDCVRTIAELGRSRVADPKGLRVLYVCEPTSVVAKQKTGDEMGYGYTETQALSEYLRYLKGSGEKIAGVRVRPHPSEARNKYQAIIGQANYGFPVEASPLGSVAEDCAWADWIVGCDSMVMALGVSAKKKVFCAIPLGGKPSTLPHVQIVQLFLARAA